MKFKRLLSGFLAALTIVGTVPTMAFAADGNGSPGVEVTGNSHISTPVGNAEDYPSIGNDGYVQMKKSAQWTNATKTEAEITFDVYGTGIPTGSDAILVMDRSGSMGECGGTEFTKIYGDWKCNKCGYRTSDFWDGKPEICTHDVSTNNRMTAAKSAADSFIDTMFKSNLDGTKSQNQVALVSFSKKATLESGFQDVDGQATLKSKVAGLVADGGTNYTNAFKAVIELLKDRPEGSPPVSIVFLTDGEPDPARYDGKTEASALKAAPYNCTIYTIGCGLSKDGASNLVTIASPDCAFDAKAPEGLTAIFTKIAGSIQKAGTNAIINDMISEYFEFDDNKTMTAGQGEAQKNGDSITWNLGDIPTTVTTLTIPIKLKAEYDKDGVYPTNNGKATLDYNNPDQAARKQEVETPQLARPLAAAEIVYFLTNDKGEAVDGNGKVLNEQEFKLTRVELKREFKSNLKVGTHEITAADTITSGGKTYKLMPNADFGNKSPYNLKVEDDNSAYTVFFGYSEVSKVKLTFDNNTEEVTTPQDTTWNDVTANLPIKNQPLESQKTLPTMTRAHYTFNGWALDKEGKTAFTTESSIDKDTTVYAQWTEHSSSNAAVRYDANNAEYTGSVPTDNNKYYLEDDVTVSAEKLSGVKNYTFKGWSTDKSATTPMTETSVKMANLTTGVTFYGVWEQNKVNVKFDANGGDAYTQPTGYDNLKAGLSLEGNQKELPNTNPTKANSQFIGWTMDKAGNVPFNVDTVLNDNGATDKTITVYAKYADVYTVKYDVNAPKDVTVGGNPTDGNNYLANAEVTLTTVPLTTAHYKFTGWSYDQAGTDLLNSKDGKFNLPANKAKNGVVTLYAVWQEDGKYPVTYNVNPPKGVTVTGTAPTEVPQYAGEYQVKSSELTAKGYIFKGYALTQNATIAYEKVEIVAPGITLYGVWEKNDKEQIHYTVEYYKNSLEAPETFTKVGDTESGGFWVGDSKTVEQAIKTNSLAPEYRQESIEVNGKKDIGMSFPITIDGTVIKVYNVLDQAPYTINYYTDDINKPVVVTGGKELIGKEVNANENAISVKLPGYKFADNQTTSMKLQADLNGQLKNNVLNIKCVQKEVKLTINYFKDGVQDTNATETKAVGVNDGKTVGSVIDKTMNSTHPDGYGNYYYEKVTGEPTIVITEDTPINTETQDNMQLNVYYVSYADYAINYFKDGEKFDTSVTGREKAGVIITAATDNMPDYYKLDTANTPSLEMKLVNGNNTLDVYYVKDESQVGSYEVQYVKADDATFTETFVSEPIWLGSQLTVGDVSNTEENASKFKAEGYSLTSIDPNQPNVLALSAKTITLTYTRDEATYTINYYKDDDTTPLGEAITGTSFAGKEVTAVELYKPVGYRLDTNKTPAMAWKLTAGENTFNVFYMTNEDEILTYKYAYVLKGETEPFYTDPANYKVPVAHPIVDAGAYLPDMEAVNKINSRYVPDKESHLGNVTITESGQIIEIQFVDLDKYDPNALAIISHLFQTNGILDDTLFPTMYTSLNEINIGDNVTIADLLLGDIYNAGHTPKSVEVTRTRLDEAPSENVLPEGTEPVAPPTDGTQVVPPPVAPDAPNGSTGTPATPAPVAPPTDPTKPAEPTTPPVGPPTGPTEPTGPVGPGTTTPTEPPAPPTGPPTGPVGPSGPQPAQPATPAPAPDTSPNTGEPATSPETNVTDDVPGARAASEEPASEETASEETASEETASEETASEETASEETASEETASEETASEETASEETASNEDDDDTVRIYGTITSTDSGSQLKEKSEAAPQDGEKIASEKLEIGLDGSFIIEEGWKYEIVITYDRTVSEPETPPGENHNPPGEGAGGPDRNIRTINEPEVPLANTPPETKTIIDEDVPLGNLPTAGGNGSKAMAKAGGLMLLVGSLLRVVTKKRKQDDE